MTELYQLPAIPPSVRVITDAEESRLKQIYANLPRSLNECPTCYGEKTFRWYKDGEFDAEVVDYECPCRSQFRLHRFFLNAGLGKRYQTLSTQDIVAADPTAIAAIGDYAANANYYISRGMGMVFSGGHGTGKTLLAAILMKRILTAGDGIECFFTTFITMMDNFVSGWRDDQLRAWFDLKIRNTPILVIDDIGKEHKGANSLASVALDSVIRSRVQNALPTIVTTNLSLDDFRSSYTSGVMSLLEETSLPYSFNGTDWRKNQGEKNRQEVANRLTRPIVID